MIHYGSFIAIGRGRVPELAQVIGTEGHRVWIYLGPWSRGCDEVAARECCELGTAARAPQWAEA